MKAGEAVAMIKKEQEDALQKELAYHKVCVSLGASRTLLGSKEGPMDIRFSFNPLKI